MDELCCLHLTGGNNGKKDHTVSCMVDQLVREGHCYGFEQFVPSSLSPPFHLCMGIDSWSLYKPNALAFRKVPRILCKAFIPRRVKKKTGELDRHQDLSVLPWRTPQWKTHSYFHNSFPCHLLKSLPPK